MNIRPTLGHKKFWNTHGKVFTFVSIKLTKVFLLKSIKKGLIAQSSCKEIRGFISALFFFVSLQTPCLTDNDGLHYSPYREQLIRISDSIILNTSGGLSERQVPAAWAPFLLGRVFPALMLKRWMKRGRWLPILCSSFWQINPKKWMGKNPGLLFPAFKFFECGIFSWTSTKLTQEERSRWCYHWSKKEN